VAPGIREVHAEERKLIHAFGPIVGVLAYWLLSGLIVGLVFGAIARGGGE